MLPPDGCRNRHQVGRAKQEIYIGGISELYRNYIGTVSEKDAVNRLASLCEQACNTLVTPSPHARLRLERRSAVASPSQVNRSWLAFLSILPGFCAVAPSIVSGMDSPIIPAMAGLWSLAQKAEWPAPRGTSARWPWRRGQNCPARQPLPAECQRLCS